MSNIIFFFVLDIRFCLVCKKALPKCYLVNGKCSACFPTSFSCNICSYTTDYKGNYSRHMMRHSGERPYTCNLCSKGFITKHHLGYHFRSVHNTELAVEKPNSFG